MPFIARCSHCERKVRAPRRKAGLDVPCPRCGRVFTLVPLDAAPATAEPVQARKEAELPAAELAEEPAEVEAVEDDRPAMQLPYTGLEYPAGVVALLLGGFGLLCASATVLCPLVVPVSGLGLLVGGLALVLARASDEPQPLFPVAGTLVSAAVLLVALGSPGWLGPTYADWRAPAPDVMAVRVLPLPGQGGEARSAEPGEWVDASRAGVQQGRVRVQVAGAAVGPRDGGAEDVLTVRLRVQEDAGALALRWRDRAAPGPPAPRATITDPTGWAYPMKDVQTAGPPPDPTAAFPLPTVTEVAFVFAPPTAAVEQLKLEVPAAAWGGTGTFRFVIPRGMFGPMRPVPEGK